MWFELNDEELNELHRAVVVKGSVPTPYRRWAKRKGESELESMAKIKIPSRGNGKGSGEDEREDGPDAELEPEVDSKEMAVKSESRGHRVHLTPSKKRRLVPNRSLTDGTTMGKNAAEVAKTRNDFATPFSAKIADPPAIGNSFLQVLRRSSMLPQRPLTPLTH